MNNRQESAVSTYYGANDARGELRIDSRDLIEARDDILTTANDAGRQWLYATERELVEAVNELEDGGIEDWEYGAQMIREDDFEDYARELAEDIGAIDRNAGWPQAYIDWEAAADALRMDYTAVTFLGHDYLVR